MAHEKRILPQKQTGSPSAPSASRRVKEGRETIPVTQWARLDATPYGHFAKIQSRNEKRRANGEELPPRQQMHMSQIHFDHFQVATGKAAINAELPKTKRCFDAKR